jgi:uncharacterized secreted protein with C-terminal beta-propeller domain
MRTHLITKIGISALPFLMLGCSGSESSSEFARPTSVPSINAATAFSGPLSRANQDEFSRFIKNGIYSSIVTRNQRFDSLESQPELSFDTNSADFSVTNVQEVGVDEADRIKYNGSTLFIAAEPYWDGEEQRHARVRIMERQHDESFIEATSLPLNESFSNISGLYEHKGNLAVLNSTMPIYTLSSFAPEPWRKVEQKVNIDLFDVSTPASPAEISKIQIDGTLLSSRRIGDFLYLVAGYTASVDELNTLASDDDTRLDNYLKIFDTPVSDLMPKIVVDSQAARNLNQPSDCVIPQQATPEDGYAHLLSVVRINLTNVSDITSSCISAVSDVMYVSQSNLYLTSSVDNQTVIHKVALDESLTYQASGLVDGIIGWRSAPNLRLSEYEGKLRIVSSDYSSREPVHHLSILEQTDNRLQTVGRLPNEQSPEPIGKPGEDIFAVRFFGERAYVVTFEQIDPLYVFDLSRADSPQILGELEIPGFSSYLHPLENGFLLGVGQQVNPRNIPEDGVTPLEPVTQEGMKLSLFDIREPSEPIEINSLVFDNSYTPVEYDYRALSVLNSQGKYRFALPIESWGRIEEQESRVWWSSNKLALLEVDTTVGSPELVQPGEILDQTQTSQYLFGGHDRSIIHQDQVYYIRGERVLHSIWQQGADVLGIY